MRDLVNFWKKANSFCNDFTFTITPTLIVNIIIADDAGSL